MILLKKMTVFIKTYIFAVVSCLYTFILGFFFAKNRVLISKICAHFGYEPKHVEPLIPKVELSELITEDISVQIREPFGVDGNVSLVELIIIAQLIRMHNFSKLFEIGTFDGRTTLNMAANSSQQAQVYTLDLPKEELYSAEMELVRGDKDYINVSSI